MSARMLTEGCVLPYSRPIYRKCGGSKSVGKERQNRLVQRGEVESGALSRRSS